MFEFINLVVAYASDFHKSRAQFLSYE
jgi:hypothetical protein